MVVFEVDGDLVFLTSLPIWDKLEMKTGTKRRTVTTDDLLRIQEEPQSKRIKLSDPAAADLGSDTDGSQVETYRDEHHPSDEDSDSDSDSDSAEFSSHDDLSSFSRVKPPPSGADAKLKVTQPPRPTSFASLGVSPDLQSALSTISIRTPTEVQAACIPPLLSGASELKPPLASI